MSCGKPEEMTILADELRIYAEVGIPKQWMKIDDRSCVTVGHYWNNIFKMKTLFESLKFSVLEKLSNLHLDFHMVMQTMKGMCQTNGH